MQDVVHQPDESRSAYNHNIRVLIEGTLTALLSNQGERSINLYFIRVPLRKKY